jgi:hypothetical protein
MNAYVSFLNFSTAFIWTLYLKFVYQLCQAPVGSYSIGQLFLTIRTNLLNQLTNTALANDCTTLITIERSLWNVEADDAFYMI